MRPHPQPDNLRRFHELEPELRGEVLGHVAVCAECRERFLAPDPSRAFALLSQAVVPQEALDRLSRRVAERTAPIRRSYRYASLAASLLLAALFGGYLLTRPTTDPGAGVAAPRVEIVEIDAAPQADTTAGSVQVISSPGTAQVLDLTVGETQVVMILDEAMDI
jgi:anti-sigma factor RsiW